MASKNAVAAAAAASATTPRASRSKCTENLNPNLSSQQSPGSKSSFPKPPSSSSPVVTKYCLVKKIHKPKTPNNSPKNKIRQRRFVVVAKKNPKSDEKEKPDNVGCKEKKKGMCLCVAYINLRKSHEEFFKIRSNDDEKEVAQTENETLLDQNQEEKGLGKGLIVKRSRERLVEEARDSVTQIGPGKVLNLVKAFEKLLTEPNSKDEVPKEEEEVKETKSSEIGVSGSSFCPPNSVLTSQNLGLDSVSSSWDSSRGSLSTRTCNGGRRSRRNSLESSSTLGGGRRWRKKQQKVTNLKPFKLRTEQRGKIKEEEFVKKVQEIMTEEEKQRIPIAQGLPWTTDEPECLVKPPVKEITMPVDLKLHTDVRALGRAEFDQQIAEKLSFIEQYKLERERQQKLAEEEEIKKLRKELVTKAQPMPFFDRPFIPRRSMKNSTMPREPKFHKKIKCSSDSWNDMNSSSSSCLN